MYYLFYIGPLIPVGFEIMPFQRDTKPAPCAINTERNFNVDIR